MGTDPSGRYVVVLRRLASAYMGLPSLSHLVTSAMCTQIRSPSPFGRRSMLIPSSTWRRRSSVIVVVGHRRRRSARPAAEHGRRGREPLAIIVSPPFVGDTHTHAEYDGRWKV